MKPDLQFVSDSIGITRREVITRLAVGGITAAVLPVPIAPVATASPVIEPKVVPENDYPYFGWEPT
jgi:hypothetical protein